jgi:hypothetical protein
VAGVRLISPKLFHRRGYTVMWRHKWGIVGVGLVLLVVAGVGVRLFLTSHERARSASCLTNVKLLTAALLAYAHDNGDGLPNALAWESCLKPYVRIEVAYLCPEDKRPNSPNPRELYRASAYDFVSYALLQRWSYCRPLEEPDPSQTILVYEIGKNGVQYRHHGGMNIGHGDGHGKWYAGYKMTPDLIIGGLAPLSDASH